MSNTYKAFYKNQEAVVSAETSYRAQLAAAAHFKAKRSFEVTVVLLAVGDREVVHSTTDLP